MTMADLVQILDEREQSAIYDRRARQLFYSNRDTAAVQVLTIFL